MVVIRPKGPREGDREWTPEPESVERHSGQDQERRAQSPAQRESSEGGAESGEGTTRGGPPCDPNPREDPEDRPGDGQRSRGEQRRPTSCYQRKGLRYPTAPQRCTGCPRETGQLHESDELREQITPEAAKYSEDPSDRKSVV